MSGLLSRWQRPTAGVGVDFGASAVKVVALGWEGAEGNLTPTLLGAGRESLPGGVVQDGVVQDPERAGAALRRLLDRLRVRCRLAALALGGGSVFLKRLPLPASESDSGSDTDADGESGVSGASGGGTFRDAVGREAARHIPFHLEELEFDFQLSPGPVTAARNAGPAHGGSLVFGAAPRSMVRAHCAAAERAGLDVGRVELEPYALFAAARLAGSPERPLIAGATGPWVAVEIGSGRAAIHVFAAPPPPFANPPRPEGDDPPPPPVPGSGGDLLASLQAPGGGELPGWAEGAEDPETIFARRIAATVREGIAEAGAPAPVPVLLSGGGQTDQRLERALRGELNGDPGGPNAAVSVLDPLRSFRDDPGGAAFAVAAGLASRQLLELEDAPGSSR